MAERESSARLFGFIEERLTGTEDIRSAGAVDYVMRSNHEHARDLLRKRQKAAVLGSATGSTSVLMFALGTAVALLLAFARVFLRHPRIVVLDEASSRLDPGTERRLEQAVDRLLEGRTGIIIAHRLATVQRADSILVLEDGQIVEYGPREDLAADPTSRFARMLRTGHDLLSEEEPAEARR